MKINHCFRINAIVGMVVLVGMLSTVAAAGDTSRPIRVMNPDKLPVELPADRTHMGTAYKPSMARLPSGELVMIALHLAKEAPGEPYHEWSELWRSPDNGVTWSEGVRVERTLGQDLIGREQFLTCIDDGTPSGVLFATCHILIADVANTDGYTHSYVSRSTDGGRNWTQTRIGTGSEWSSTSRNVVEMPNGTLMLGVSKRELPGSKAAWWTSTDKGVNWTESDLITPPMYTNWEGTHMEHNNHNGFFEEDFTYRTDSGKLLHWIRCHTPGTMFPMSSDAPSGNDQVNRMLMTKSTDDGMTWSDLVDFPAYDVLGIEGYGQHYPRVTKLADGRLMMTYTKRWSSDGNAEPLGLRALFSHDDGETWNWDHDLLIIDENTPSGWASGGGFGNTIQLADGSLISCYSYHDEVHGQENYQTEVVRWSVSSIPEPSSAVLLGVGALCGGIVIIGRRLSAAGGELKQRMETSGSLALRGNEKNCCGKF